MAKCGHGRELEATCPVCNFGRVMNQLTTLQEALAKSEVEVERLKGDKNRYIGIVRAAVTNIDLLPGSAEMLLRELVKEHAKAMQNKD